MSESLGLARKFSRPSFPQSSSGNPSQPDSAAAPPGCPLKDRGHDGIVHLGLCVAGATRRCGAAFFWRRLEGRPAGDNRQFPYQGGEPIQGRFSHGENPSLSERPLSAGATVQSPVDRGEYLVNRDQIVRVL